MFSAHLIRRYCGCSLPYYNIRNATMWSAHNVLWRVEERQLWAIHTSNMARLDKGTQVSYVPGSLVCHSKRSLAWNLLNASLSEIRYWLYPSIFSASTIHRFYPLSEQSISAVHLDKEHAHLSTLTNESWTSLCRSHHHTCCTELLRCLATLEMCNTPIFSYQWWREDTMFDPKYKFSQKPAAQNYCGVSCISLHIPENFTSSLLVPQWK